VLKQAAGEFFSQDVVSVARQLIGSEFYVDDVGGRIIDTEAYHRNDLASHCYRGPIARNASVFGSVGHAYLYRSHGLHRCVCLVAGDEPGAAVLIRALEPLSALQNMRASSGGRCSQTLRRAKAFVSGLGDGQITR
jgi:DNA-3-methyladenine glycosylase